MHREGVTPARPGKPRNPATPPRPRPGKHPPAATKAAPRPAPTKPAPPPPAAPAKPSLERQLATLRAEHTALTARHAALITDHAAAILATTELHRELTTLRHDTTVATTHHHTALTTLTTELTRTRAALHAAQHPPPSPRHTLAAALTTRGLDPDERAQALALLATSESATSLLEQLETRDPVALAALLERRLALVCGDPACAPELAALALRVPRPRCEVCGGSDIQRAAHGFVRACQAAGIVRVRFVGGSPNYRTKLDALFPSGGPLIVRSTAGDRRVRLNQAKSQQRSDDLVIIWGASELDHATSGAYRSEHGRTEVIAHRGIGRMLDLAAARIHNA